MLENLIGVHAFVVGEASKRQTVALLVARRAVKAKAQNWQSQKRKPNLTRKKQSEKS